MSARADIEKQIQVETDACVEDRKKNAFLGGFFTPRKAIAPGCELDVRNKYAGVLAQVEAADNTAESATRQAYIDQVSGKGNYKLYGIIIATFVFMLLIVWIMD